MAALEIEYEGNTILSLDGADTKILRTAQKYLDDDITVHFSGGGGSNIYSIPITVPTAQTGTYTLVSSDSFIAAHYNDSSLILWLIRLDAPVSYTLVSVIAKNSILLGSSYYQAIEYMNNNYTQHTNQTLAPTSTPGTNSAGMFVNSNGDVFTVNASNRRLGAGNYLLIALI